MFQCCITLHSLIIRYTPTVLWIVQISVPFGLLHLSSLKLFFPICPVHQKGFLQWKFSKITSKADKSLRSRFSWLLLMVTITVSLVCKDGSLFHRNNNGKNLQHRILKDSKGWFQTSRIQINVCYRLTSWVAFLFFFSDSPVVTLHILGSPCWQAFALPKCCWARYWS